MATIKYKISDIATDLEVKAPEIVALLGQYFEGKRTRNTAPEQDELDMIFEVYTKQFETDSLDSYFAMTAPAAEATEKPAKKTSSKTKKDEKAEEPAPEEKAEEKKPTHLSTHWRYSRSWQTLPTSNRL